MLYSEAGNIGVRMSNHLQLLENYVQDFESSTEYTYQWGIKVLDISLDHLIT